MQTVTDISLNVFACLWVFLLLLLLLFRLFVCHYPLLDADSDWTQ
jgi:hypothetical protein